MVDQAFVLYRGIALACELGGSAHVRNYPSVSAASGKGREVEAMFDAIAPRYDVLNRILSLGLDKYWRRRVVGMLRGVKPRRVLDVATGTGDLAFAASRLPSIVVTGVDISEAMLSRARLKAVRRDCSILFLRADAAALPFPGGTFDAVTVGFGMRNFEDLHHCLVELHRVLVPGAVLIVLEFSQPRQALVRWLCDLYERGVVPWIGRLVSRDEGAYCYLPDSIASFNAAESVLHRFTEAGFEGPQCCPLTFGVVSLYTARKPAG